MVVSFLNPIVFERDLETGKKVSRVYYCDPYSSWQKSFIEKFAQKDKNCFT